MATPAKRETPRTKRRAVRSKSTNARAPERANHRNAAASTDAASTDAGATDAGADHVDQQPRIARQQRLRDAEHLTVLVVALALGLIGFAFHAAWFAAVVLMAILIGLMASDLRANQDGGAISAVVAAVTEESHDVASALGKQPSADDEDRA